MQPNLKTPYLESTIILALVIVNPALIIISINSPILGIASGLIKASVLGREEKTKWEIQSTLLSLEDFVCMLSLYSGKKNITLKREILPQSNILISVSLQFPHSSWMVQDIILIRMSSARYNFLSFLIQDSSQCSTSSRYLLASPFMCRANNLTTSSLAGVYLYSSSVMAMG